MIIFGTGAKIIKADIIADNCPNCNGRDTVQMNVIQKWAHIFWIPFFPVGKSGVSQCLHCQQVLKSAQMPPTLGLSYDNLKSHTKTPLWTFSGIGLIILIAIGVIISNKQTAQKITKMIPALKHNDVLQIKLDDGAYTLAKVTRVKGDSVFVLINNYQTDRSSDIYKLEEKGYAETEEAFTIANLKEMDREELILDIERK